LDPGQLQTHIASSSSYATSNELAASVENWADISEPQVLPNEQTDQ